MGEREVAFLSHYDFAQILKSSKTAERWNYLELFTESSVSIWREV